MPKTPSDSAGSDRPYIGGQAVLEGVMMRAPSSFAVVVRRRDGSLTVRERGMQPEERGWAKWPLLRGVASLVEYLQRGSEAVRFSADQMTRDFEGAAPAATASSTLSGVLRALGLSTFLLATTEGSV